MSAKFSIRIYLFTRPREIKNKPCGPFQEIQKIIKAISIWAKQSPRTPGVFNIITISGFVQK